jgi:hypothetical protein
MSGFRKRYALAVRHIEKLSGGSQPILVEASDGLCYVIKFTNNLQGRNLSFNESIGTELFLSCGLASPSWKPVLVTDAFIDQNPECWIETPEGRLRPTPGFCFGSRFLGGDGVELLDVLPGNCHGRIWNLDSFWLAWLIDICAEHADNRQAIFVRDARGWLHAFFVDHGHLFGGPNGNTRPHFLASRYLDPRIYRGVPSHHLPDSQKIARYLDTDQIWAKVRALPDQWKVPSALEGLLRCICRLSNPDLLHNIVETMKDAQAESDARAIFTDTDKQFPKAPVLRGKLLPPWIEDPFVSSRVGRSDCA